MVEEASPRVVVVDPTLLDEQQLAVVQAAARSAVWFQADDAGFVAMLDDAQARFAPGRPSDALAIVFTSGTTGRSKGAVLSQTFMLLEADAYIRVVEPRESGETFWTVLPLFHTNALCLTLVGALLSGEVGIVRNGFSASRFWDQIRSDGATVTNLLGAMVPILLKAPPSKDRDHHLRLVAGGGVPGAAVEEFELRFGVEFREIYGLTETGMNAGQTSATRKRGSVGKAFEHWDVRVDGEPGTEGEIQIRGLSPGAVLECYWADEERTHEAFTADGFFRTGDLGRLDCEGYLYFLGRIKDCIRRRGENISPLEVELAVSRHPAVAECAAVGVPSPLGEDEVKLAYVLLPGAELSPDDLHTFCQQEMAGFMVPRYLEAVAALPKTATEKVERHLLTALGPGVRDFAPLQSR